MKLKLLLLCVVILAHAQKALCLFLGLKTKTLTLSVNGGKGLVSEVSLSQLSNHEETGAYLQRCVTEWLDEEFITQKVHEKIGRRCREIYVDIRKEGIDEIGEFLITCGTRLEGEDFQDAFVNCWDVANKCSDLLMVRMKMELCQCAGDLSWAMAASTHSFSDLSIKLNSEFERYRYLQGFLEGDFPLSSIVPVMAISLGFRDSIQGNISPVQDKRLAPLGWESLTFPPDFSDLQDETLDSKLEEDLPEDSGGVDIALETLVGLEYYKLMKKSDDRDTKRRIMVAKWLYLYNFFTDFPHNSRFVPVHLAYRLEE